MVRKGNVTKATPESEYGSNIKGWGDSSAVKALVALSEDPGSIPRIYIMVLNHL